MKHDVVILNGLYLDDLEKDILTLVNQGYIMQGGLCPRNNGGYVAVLIKQLTP